MKLVLLYKNLTLGELIKENNLYHFTLNEKDYLKFQEYYLASKSFELKTCQSKELFFPFTKLLESLKNRNDLLQKINATLSTDDFEILCKGSNLKQSTFSYHLKLKK